MTTPLPFRTQLRHDETTELHERDASWHAHVAERYAREAAAQMGSLIDRDAGSASPPHALRFAELHAQLALVRAQVELQ